MANFGESLKRERELRDIPLRDIANATKINLRYLEALEANRFDKLPGGVFNKGFIRAYARFIGADGEALVQLYMEVQAEREAADASAQPTPDRPGTMRPAQGPPRRRADAAAPAGASPNARTSTNDTATSSLSFAEGQAASAAVAAMAAARKTGGAGPAAVSIPPFGSSGSGSQARLVLAGTTVVAAFAAIGIVLYLVRSARQDVRPVGGPDSAPISAPGTSGDDPANAVPEDSDAMEDGTSPDAPATATPEGAAPPATGQPASPAPAPATPHTLPEVPRERDGTTPPVRVASPVPTPITDPSKPAPRPSAPPPQAPAPAPTAGGTGTEQRVPRESPVPSSPPGPMNIVVRAVSPVRVQLGCDGVDGPVRQMAQGEVLVLRCFSLVRISAEDAGAVQVSLDGAACPPLGAAGNRVEHYTIRAEDARAICPAGGGPGRR